MNSDPYVPLSAVMEVLVGLCPECREEVKQRLNFAAIKPACLDQTLNDIIGEVCARTGIPKGVLLSRNATSPLVQARRTIACRARELGYSFPRIAAALNKHHTTIIHLTRTNHAPNKEAKTGSEVPAAPVVD